MIKIENTDVYGWEAAIRGMRNPMNSWDKSDSKYYDDCGVFRIPKIGGNDLKLMKNLSKAGSDHGKFLRMITVTVDITAPLYWWKEFDTYKVGTVANSCSTMHKIHAKEFTLDDFSHEHLVDFSLNRLYDIIGHLNICRKNFIEYDEEKEKEKHPAMQYEKKDYWWQMIQLLPSSYNQRRTVQLNYQVLKNMYHARKNHKLDCWVDFCKWCETLPYFKEICIEVE
jgi:hypothetical protein